MLVVTHWPQVAARGAHHYRIEKSHEGVTRTSVRKLTRRAARGNRADAVGRGDHQRAREAATDCWRLHDPVHDRLISVRRGLAHELLHDGQRLRGPGWSTIPNGDGYHRPQRGFAERLVEVGYSALLADLYRVGALPAFDRDEAIAAMISSRGPRQRCATACFGAWAGDGRR